MDTTSVHLVNEADEPIQADHLRNDSIIADFDHLINPGELGEVEIHWVNKIRESQADMLGQMNTEFGGILLGLSDREIQPHC